MSKTYTNTNKTSIAKNKRNSKPVCINTTIRTKVIKLNKMLFKNSSKQLAAQGLIVSKDTIVDATIVPNSHPPTFTTHKSMTIYYFQPNELYMQIKDMQTRIERNVY